MIIFKDRVLAYMNTWLDGMARKLGSASTVCVVSGGLDSCVVAALCSVFSNNIPTNIIFMGFKKSKEDALKKWIEQNARTKHSFVDPDHVELNLPGLEDVDKRSSMIITYLDLYSKRYNAMTVGAVTRSEYNLVRFVRERVDTLYDSYPLIDLYRSEVKQLAGHLKLPGEIIDDKSITEESFGYTFDELEWLDRENENLSIVSSMKNPNTARHWAIYDARNKNLAGTVYRLNKESENIEIQDKKKCLVRKALPGLLT